MTTTTGQHIGVIGLGVMGRAMAANLNEGTNQVVGFDASRTTLAALAGTLNLTDTLTKLVHAVDIVLLSLPGPDACHAVLDEVIEQTTPGMLIIDASTVDPQTATDLAAQASSSGLDFVSAPVIGGQHGAQSGELTVIAGGTVGALERAKPILNLIGSNIQLVDSPSVASALKLLNNLMSLGNTVVFAEALALASKVGVSAAVVHDALHTGSGSSTAFDRRFAANIGPRQFEPGFAVDLAVKDMRLVQQFASSTGLTLPAVENTLATFNGLANEGFGGKDVSILIRWWEGKTGQRIAGT